jgi:hypothetical protein
MNGETVKKLVSAFASKDLKEVAEFAQSYAQQVRVH